MPAEKFSRPVENMIAQIRGVPLDTSRSRPRDTRALGDLVEQLLHKHRIGMATPEDAIRDSWKEIVGAQIAHLCHPLRIDRSRTLIVGVGSPVVRQELFFHRAEVLKRIQAIPACHHIQAVSFRAG
jgi:hypothetical protein